MAEITVDTTTNSVVVTSTSNTVEVIKPTTKILEIGALGPQGPGGSRAIYGSFYDDVDQPLLAANTPQVITYNTTVEALGVSISSNSRVLFSLPGTFSLTYSIQFLNTDNSVQLADVWLKKNGANVAESNSRFDVPARKSAGVYGHLIGTVNYVLTLAAGDYVELFWTGTSTTLSIEAIPAQTTPSIPSTPGVILTAVQVMYLTEGPQGPAGPNSIGGYGFTIVGPQAGDILGFNGTTWYNRPQITVTDGGNF